MKTYFVLFKIQQLFYNLSNFDFFSIFDKVILLKIS